MLLVLVRLQLRLRLPHPLLRRHHHLQFRAVRNPIAQPIMYAAVVLVMLETLVSITPTHYHLHSNDDDYYTLLKQSTEISIAIATKENRHPISRTAVVVQTHFHLMHGVQRRAQSRQRIRSVAIGQYQACPLRSQIFTNTECT
jgi:hypothetical protein